MALEVVNFSQKVDFEMNAEIIHSETDSLLNNGFHCKEMGKFIEVSMNSCLYAWSKQLLVRLCVTPKHE